MQQDNTGQRKKATGIKYLILILTVLIVLVIAAFFILTYFTGNTPVQGGNAPARDSTEKNIHFLDPAAIGEKFTAPPQIANLCVADLDGDKLPDVVVCDAKSNTVSWIRQYPAGKFTEAVLYSELAAPAHVQVIDVDNDGDKDLVVALLGSLFPNNAKIGSVVVLENDGHTHFKKHVIAENIARVSDVRAGDLDGDGDLDLAVAQFGYNDGETRWMENLGTWKFAQHNLQNLSGPINVIISDVDKDGDLDIVSLVSQEWEEIYCFVNDGKGKFTPKLIWGSNNEDFGSSSISLVDLDKDGDEDILYTNGDSFNYYPPAIRAWHGVQWLENKGAAGFAFHRICKFPGAYSSQAYDIDDDGDMDVFAVSAFNVWENPEAQSLIWMENTGNMQFTQRDIANKPTHLITLQLGDFNHDGLMDLVTGGMHLYPPYDRMGRVTVWMNNGGLGKKTR